MAAACARGLLEIAIKQHTTACYRCPPQLRQFVTTSSQWNAPVSPPKRPPGAFIIFHMNKRADILKNNPGINVKDSVKIAAQMWNQLPSDEKNGKLTEARQRLDEYYRQYESFRKDLTPNERTELVETNRLKRQVRAKRRKKLELKKMGKPTKARNAFSLFVKSSKLERGDAPITEFLKGLTEYWKLMPQEEKDIYVEDARLDRDRYDREMKVWEEKMREMGREDLIRIKYRTKVKKTRSPKSPAKKRATSKKRKATKKTTTKAKSKSVSTQTD